MSGTALGTRDTQIKRTPSWPRRCCQLYSRVKEVTRQFESTVIIFLKPQVRRRGSFFVQYSLHPLRNTYGGTHPVCWLVFCLFSVLFCFLPELHLRAHFLCGGFTSIVGHWLRSTAGGLAGAAKQSLPLRPPLCGSPSTRGPDSTPWLSSGATTGTVSLAPWPGDHAACPGNGLVCLLHSLGT